MLKARISEVFLSKQGEGPFIGIDQIFIRFAGCSLDCIYCDTDTTVFTQYSVDELLKKVLSFKEEVDSVSITGGEPLEQVSFLEKFLPELKAAEYEVYLETNGLLYKELERVIEFVDIIAMDIKLPSVMKRPECWTDHLNFLRIAVKKYVFCKLVTSEETDLEDIKKAGELISKVDKHIETIIQPVSSLGYAGEITIRQKKYKKMLKPYLCNVNIIPQMHKVWGIK
ncbi:MAG: 7-carboxy-7-deazaguanine synthase QueE [Candidatus Omnitrophica bacterium]|nr:7-carboxy-7-deazaguanine synthase QueE [Candidatus Omnitrophota bacterium]